MIGDELRSDRCETEGEAGPNLGIHALAPHQSASTKLSFGQRHVRQGQVGRPHRQIARDRTSDHGRGSPTIDSRRPAAKQHQAVSHSHPVRSAPATHQGKARGPSRSAGLFKRDCPGNNACWMKRPGRMRARAARFRVEPTLAGDAPCSFGSGMPRDHAYRDRPRRNSAARSMALWASARRRLICMKP